MVRWVALLLCCTPVVGWSAGLFGSIEFRADSLSALPRWERVVNKLTDEHVLFAACDEDMIACTDPALFTWRAFMAGLRSEESTKRELAEAVHSFVNRWPYITDNALWGQSDYWATPTEFLNHSGDCEDYAILKYVSLRELGFSADDVRIVVVKDTVRDIAHAVLAVNLPEEGEEQPAEQVILDSLYNVILSQDQLMQYIPYYSVNENSRWAHIMPLTP